MNKCRQRFDIDRLKHPDVNKDFVLELRNRFSVLATTTSEEVEEGQSTVDKQWATMRSIGLVQER